MHPARDTAGAAPAYWPPTIAELKARLDIVDAARGYTDLARRGRAYWGRCPVHGERTPSFKVDPDRQAFICFGCGAKGDVVDLLVAAEGLDLRAAVRRARELAGGTAPAAPRGKAVARNAGRAEHNRELAQRAWRESEVIRDELPLRYLRERRGIRAWDDDRLRWHPGCPWGQGTAGCLVAPVTCHRAGLTVAVWRVLPAPEGPIERRGLGPVKGNACRLFPLDGPRLVIAEGVEDALAAHELFGTTAWAALSAGNLGDLVLPARAREVLILADRDEPGKDGRRPGLDNAHRLARRLRGEGRTAEVRWAKTGKDANDVLRAGRAG